MKMNSKKIFMSFLGLAMILSFVLPSVSFAQKTPSKTVFCSRIDQIIAPIERRMADRGVKINARWQEIDVNLAKRVTNRDNLLLNNRSVRDENREAQYAKLEAKAITDAQKQAVANFKVAVEAAINTRKSAIDSAILALRQSVGQSVDVRRSAVTAAMNEFKSSKSGAVEKAKADCVAGVDPKTIRETFRVNMKVAQDKFKSDYQAIDKLKGSFESVRNTKKQEVETAIAVFKATMEKAKADLKAAF